MLLDHALWNFQTSRRSQLRYSKGALLQYRALIDDLSVSLSITLMLRPLVDQ